LIPIPFVIFGITFWFLSFLFNLSNWEAGACSVFVFALFNFLKRLAVKFVFLNDVFESHIVAKITRFALRNILNRKLLAIWNGS
jgi:hypothetical protein